MRSRRSHLVLVAIIVAALAGTAALALTRSTTLGLDLQGGISVTLKAQPPKGHKLTSAELDRSVNIIRERIDKLGVSEPDVRKQDPDQIVIELAGVRDVQRALNIIGKTAQLELYDLETSLTGPSIDAQRQPRPLLSLYTLLSGQQALAGKGEPSAYYLFRTTRKTVEQPSAKGAKAKASAPKTKVVTRRKLVAGPASTKAQLLRTFGGKVPANGTILAVPQNTVVVTCSAADRFCPGPQGGFVPAPGQTAYYLFKHDPKKGVPQMTGADLKSDGTRQDFDSRTNEPIVLMDFTSAGSKKFQQVTREEWLRGKLRGAPQHFAIVLDREIKSFPQIDPTDKSLANGISGNAQISGIGSVQEAKDLALVLQTGALPVNFVTLSTDQVSATLGKDSLNEAKLAAIVGLILVALFLLVFYRFLGVIAVLGLGIYAAFLYAAILLFKVTLTLPGFAGLILTIGVAADANVVIFERIKEEVRAGKSVRAAISAGYAKGFHTIVDANVVTAITALVLFAVATAGVRGFALLLLIGTIISMITAVAATRAMLGLLAGFRWFDNPRFMGASPVQHGKWLQIDFMRRKTLWFAISGVVVVVAAVSIGVQGLNWGIDFRGGSQITFKTESYVPLPAVRQQFAQIGRGGALIQGRGASRGESYRQFQARTDSLTRAEQGELTQDLQQRFGRNLNIGVKNVSSSFGRQVARLGIIAVLVSLLLIVGYVALRFEFKYSLPVIVAMLHDILITIGIYSLSQREVSTSTVAAVLTVLGYSIYDTIIIFDRVRENVPIMRRHSFATIANVSLWETIRRSLATTFITLLPVAALLGFGGATLKDFAFALLIGIGSGAYSSIFIAAPLLTLWKEREPEWRRRKQQDERTASTPAAREAVLEEAEEAAAGEPAPETPLLPPAAPAGDGDGAPAVRGGASKRARRQQRRSARPHGRAR